MRLGLAEGARRSRRVVRPCRRRTHHSGRGSPHIVYSITGAAPMFAAMKTDTIALLVLAAIAAVLLIVSAYRSAAHGKDDDEPHVPATEDDGGHVGMLLNWEDFDRDPETRRKRAMLRSEEGRRTLRAEARSFFEYTHPEMAEVLELSRGEVEAFFSLLTDQQMAHLERFYFSRPGVDDLEAFAERDEERAYEDEARLAALLGAEKFRRYKQYRETSNARIRVRLLQERLAPPQRLTAEQKTRLIALIKTEERRRLEWRPEPPPAVMPALEGMFPPRIDPEFMHRRSIEANEALVVQLERSNDRLCHGAAEFLSRVQLARLVEMAAEDLAAQRHWVEKLHAQTRST
jgi:hypothetical protein